MAKEQGKVRNYQLFVGFRFYQKLIKHKLIVVYCILYLFIEFFIVYILFYCLFVYPFLDKYY